MNKQSGFTLIELSIVLVIIGLIIGGVLTGQDLIRSAQVRATITQIEKYNTATRTFQGKYGALPGDLNGQVATQFGFSARGAYAGEGDGNGVIQGVRANSAGQNRGVWQGAGETTLFWVDLTTANGLNVNLVEGGFSTATATTIPGTITNVSSPTLAAYLPEAKLGGGNYIYVWSGGWNETNSPDGYNYFGLSLINTLQGVGGINSMAGLTVAQAYNIDKKMDDGLPQSGTATALYLWGSVAWADGARAGGASDPITGGPTTIATPASTTTCYDNNNAAGVTEQYSMSQSNGRYLNCTLSFRLQ